MITIVQLLTLGPLAGADQPLAGADQQPQPDGVHAGYLLGLITSVQNQLYIKILR